MANHLPAPAEASESIERYGAASTAGMVYRPEMDDSASGGNVRALLRRVVGALWRYKWLALAIVIVGAAAGFVISRYMVKPEYGVMARLWVEGERRGTPGNQGPIQTSQLLNTTSWTELVRSFTVLEPVVHELRLYLEPRGVVDSALFASFQVDASLQPGVYRLRVDRSAHTYTLLAADGRAVESGGLGGPVGSSVGFRWVPPAAALTAGQEIEFTVRRPREVALTLSKNLQAHIRETGNFLTLGLVGRDPERLARTLNAVGVRFAEVAADLKRAQSEELAEILQEQLQHAASNLRDTEAALQSFRVGTVTLPSDRVIQQAPGLQATQSTVFSDFFMLKMERDQLRRDREAIEAALAAAGRSPLSVTALEVVGSVRQSSELVRALGDLTAKRAELRAMQNQFTDQYLPVQRLADEVRTLEQQVVPRLAAQLVTDIAVREREMDARIGSASDELRQIPQRSIEEARLERNLAIASELYTMLQSRYETARLAKVSSLPDLRMLDYATVPHEPINGKERLRLFLMILLGSLGLAVAVPVLLDRVDPRLRYPEQVTHELGLPILGAVPHIAAQNGAGRRLGHGETIQAVEAFREIRLNVAHAFGAAGPLLTTITSPGSGDGKSFVSSNLALAFADLGYRTLLIDGDIRRGQLHRLLGITRVPGLTDYLAGRATIEQIVQPTPFESLHLVPGGTRMQTGPELLGSAAMSALVRELRTRYEVILVDSPPLGAGVDPFLLSTLTGNALLVLRNGRTDREFAQTKLDLLDRLPVRLLGAVLNDVPATGAYRYYSYLPGYGAEAEGFEEGEPRQLEGV